MRSGLVFAMLLLMPLALSSPASAQFVLRDREVNWCALEGETVWVAPRPDQHDLGRVTIQLSCIDDIVTHARVKAETRCGRALCTWSWSERAEQVGVTLEAVFFTFSATRTMKIHVDGRQLNVIVSNDYNQEGRASDTMQAVLNRQ